MARAAEDTGRTLVTPTGIEVLATEFLSLKNQIDALKTRQDELKADIIEYIDTEIEPGADGHKVLSFPEKIEGFAAIQRQRRVKRTVNIDVSVAILEALGIADTCIRYVPELDEDAVFSNLYEGKLTEEQIDRMLPETVTFAVVPKRR
jgi:hypothetical protein